MSDADFLRELSARRRAESEATLDTAKQTAIAGGKEPYDYARLDSLYRRPPPLCPTSDGEAEELEWRYYVLHKDVQTLEEFARVLELNDRYDGGDMHLDES